VEWFFGLFLTRTFLEIASLTSQPQFNDVVLHAPRRILRTNIDDSFHVATFSPNQSSCNLEFFLVYNLDVKSSCILNRIRIIVLTVIHLARLRLSLLFLLRKLFSSEVNGVLGCLRSKYVLRIELVLLCLYDW
jgi:hypothetical protein